MLRLVASITSLSILTFAVFACSAPAVTDPALDGDEDATEEESTSKPKKDAGKGTSTPGNDSEGEEDTDASTTKPTNACTQQAGEACYTCCEQANDPETSMAESAQIWEQCVCTQACAAECGNNACQGGEATAACEQCSNAADTCIQQADAACDKNPGCKALTECYIACDDAQGAGNGNGGSP